jgi:hypothetical protein
VEFDPVHPELFPPNRRAACYLMAKKRSE